MWSHRVPCGTPRGAKFIVECKDVYNLDQSPRSLIPKDTNNTCLSSTCHGWDACALAFTTDQRWTRAVCMCNVTVFKALWSDWTEEKVEEGWRAVDPIYSNWFTLTYIYLIQPHHPPSPSRTHTQSYTYWIFFPFYLMHASTSLGLPPPAPYSHSRSQCHPK